MAEVWLVFEGEDPTRGGPLATLPLSECEAKLQITASSFASELAQGPRFGDRNKKLAGFREPRHVVVKVEDPEARSAGWKPGYYLSPLSPEEARNRCGGDQLGRGAAL